MMGRNRSEPGRCLCLCEQTCRDGDDFSSRDYGIEAPTHPGTGRVAEQLRRCPYLVPADNRERAQRSAQPQSSHPAWGMPLPQSARRPFQSSAGRPLHPHSLVPQPARGLFNDKHVVRSRLHPAILIARCRRNRHGGQGSGRSRTATRAVTRRRTMVRVGPMFGPLFHVSLGQPVAARGVRRRRKDHLQQQRADSDRGQSQRTAASGQSRKRELHGVNRHKEPDRISQLTTPNHPISSGIDRKRPPGPRTVHTGDCFTAINR